MILLINITLSCVCTLAGYIMRLTIFVGSSIFQRFELWRLSSLLAGEMHRYDLEKESSNMFTPKWFSNVGRDQSSSLKTWDDWPGPEVPECEAIGLLTQECFDTLSSQIGINYETFIAKVREVLTQIAQVHEYDEEQDYYDPKTSAAWEAAWWAALVFFYDKHNLEIPVMVQKVTDLLVMGHWPYGIRDDGELLIF